MPAWAELTDVDDEPTWATTVLDLVTHVVREHTRHLPPAVKAIQRPAVTKDAAGIRRVHAGVEGQKAIELAETVLGVASVASPASRRRVT